MLILFCSFSLMIYFSKGLLVKMGGVLVTVAGNVTVTKKFFDSLLPASSLRSMETGCFPTYAIVGVMVTFDKSAAITYVTGVAKVSLNRAVTTPPS